MLLQLLQGLWTDWTDSFCAGTNNTYEFGHVQSHNHTILQLCKMFIQSLFCGSNKWVAAVLIFLSNTCLIQGVSQPVCHTWNEFVYLIFISSYLFLFNVNVFRDYLHQKSDLAGTSLSYFQLLPIYGHCKMCRQEMPTCTLTGGNSNSGKFQLKTLPLICATYFCVLWEMARLVMV